MVIFAAWYLMWMFQRVIMGRSPGSLPEPGDNALTVEEQALLAANGGHHGHGLAQPAIAGGSGDHPAADDHGASKWHDLNWSEALCLFPLAALTIFFGVYPKPLFDILQPALERIIAPFLT